MKLIEHTVRLPLYKKILLVVLAIIAYDALMYQDFLIVILVFIAAGLLWRCEEGMACSETFCVLNSAEQNKDDRNKY